MSENEQSTDNGEWGWDASAEDDIQENTQNISPAQSSSKDETEAEPKSIVKKILSSKKNSFNNHSNLQMKGITSSPSFQELEKAIGATLALSLASNDSASELSDKSLSPINSLSRSKLSSTNLTQQKLQHQRMRQQQHQYQDNRRNSPYNQQQTRFFPTGPHPTVVIGAIPPSVTTKEEMAPFLLESESRAIVILHSANISSTMVRNACLKFGSLYYIRPEFHSRGVTLISYYDLRAAESAMSGMVEELGTAAEASVHYSVMLHTTNNNSEEFRLVVDHLPTGATEVQVEEVFARFGSVRRVTKEERVLAVRSVESNENLCEIDSSRDGEGVDSVSSASISTSSSPASESSPQGADVSSIVSFSVEFFSIQDARLAVSELSATTIAQQQAWGANTTIKPAPMDSHKQLLCRQLLATLSRWKAEMTLAGPGFLQQAGIGSPMHNLVQMNIAQATSGVLLPQHHPFPQLISPSNHAVNQNYMFAYGPPPGGVSVYDLQQQQARFSPVTVDAQGQGVGEADATAMLALQQHHHQQQRSMYYASMSGSASDLALLGQQQQQQQHNQMYAATAAAAAYNNNLMIQPAGAVAGVVPTLEQQQQQQQQLFHHHQRMASAAAMYQHQLASHYSNENLAGLHQQFQLQQQQQQQQQPSETQRAQEQHRTGQPDYSGDVYRHLGGAVEGDAGHASSEVLASVGVEGSFPQPQQQLQQGQYYPQHLQQQQQYLQSQNHSGRVPHHHNGGHNMMQQQPLQQAHQGAYPIYQQHQQYGAVNNNRSGYRVPSAAAYGRGSGGPMAAGPHHHHNGHLGHGNSSGASQPQHHHNQIDADFALDLTRIGEDKETRTTIMVRNIPNKYNQQMLLDEVNQRHEGTYDFFYLPIDFKNRCNVGYCFINFLDARHIAPFVHEFNGQRWKSFNSEKVCAVSFARIQGKGAMIARFQNSSLLEKDDEYQPLLFYSSGPDLGKPEPFPSGSRHQQQPHIHQNIHAPQQHQHHQQHQHSQLQQQSQPHQQRLSIGGRSTHDYNEHMLYSEEQGQQQEGNGY